MTMNLAEGAVLVRASDGCIVYTNPRFEELFGYGPKELIGEPVTVLNAGSEQEASELAQTIIGQLTLSGRYRGELKNVRKDGSEFWCSTSVSAFDHEDFGKVWIAVHTDITERKQLEEKNAQALRDKEVLLKEIHHRVKNNLQVISSLFSLQRERTQNEELRRMLDESRTRVQSIALVHEHLYRSPDLAVVDFDQYLRSLVFAIRESYGAERVEFEVDASDVVLDVEEAVPCALLVCELVSNALKHAFAGGPGKVRVTARHEGLNLCVLEVADDGRGVPADFDWMNARSLGLRLVRALSHQLRGTTVLDRSAGTCFRIRFALRHPRAASTTTPAHALGHPGPS
jgi:PAS domain S-box-containing protein